MLSNIHGFIFFFVFCLTTLVTSQTVSDSSDGYAGYSLEFEGDKDSVVYDTSSTASNISTISSPDVYLNASLHVGEIDILVANLSAKINLDAQVLNLLKFNAGVDAQIDRVQLLIQNVTAKVLLEARLENLVLMIGDILDSLDLNPVLATLGQDVGDIVNTTLSGLTDTTAESAAVVPRNWNLEHNVLYSVNDYSGRTHTNRVLTQSGSIVDQFLDNEGVMHSQTVVGDYLKDMTFNGYNKSIVLDGHVAQELEYVYAPFPGLSVVSAVFLNSNGSMVVATKVLSESSAGGSSTVGDL
jgi:hypothetical protein